MDEVLNQVGGLFLRAIPTMVIFSLLWWAYRVLVHNRLVAVLAERRERTEGAMEKARADIAAAEASTHDYEQRIRDAKLGVYKAQEARRRQHLEARTAMLAEARRMAEERVQAARKAIERDVAQAKVGLQAETDALASEIIRTVLKPAATAPVAGGAK